MTNDPREDRDTTYDVKPPLKVVKPVDFDDLLRKALDNVDYLMISAERLYREARAVKVKLELMKSVRSIEKG